ncbi:MAG: DUF6597 domain-containing transcriptional factor [Bacteroidota bacterium]
MKFEQLQPSGELKEYVKYFWTLQSQRTGLLPKTLGPLADGCPGLLFQPKEQGTFYDQRQKDLPETFLYGQTITRTEIFIIGEFKTTGVCFHPHALKHIFSFSADELTDTCLDVNLISSSKDFRLTEKLLNAESPDKQVDTLSAYLMHQIKRNDLTTDNITRYALTEIIQSRGQASLKELQKKLKLSERSFERKFNQYVGISPKLFSNVCRFQASLKQLKNNSYTKLSDIAFDNGYSDQSHFIRSFKEFAGYTPHQFQKKQNLVMENFQVTIG